jgi:uncharacterized protein YndB with AHSA1/START domain
MQITHSIEIAAPVARVWALTLDAESRPDFTSTMTRVEWITDPPVRVGSQARVKQPAQSAKLWTVTVLDAERCFAWTTRSMGLRMTATHRLAATDAGTTNALEVEIEGLFAPLFGLLFRSLIRKALATENEGFRRAAEGDRT